MKYFWVNQKQTYTQERSGGYLWAPQRNINGNQFWHWLTMTEVKKGDIIFNNVNGALRSYCIAKESAVESPKPNEITQEWEELGWKVNADYHDLEHPIIISEHMEKLENLFPEKYSPYSIKHQKANQVYLVELNEKLGKTLAEIGGTLISLESKPNTSQESKKSISNNEEKILQSSSTSKEFIPTATEKEIIVKHRVTQGRFRSDLIKRYGGKCAVTGLDIESLLIASHIKPWSESSTKEKNDPDNGLLLAAHIDKLFDKHLISFDVKGNMIISNRLSHRQRSLLGISLIMKINVLSEGNQKYLRYHRNNLEK